MIFRMPSDGWGPIVPRNWQAEELPKVLAEYSKPDPISSIVRAVTGSGKSIFMAQTAACCQLEPHESVVVSTSSIFLVEQLEDTFKARFDGGFMEGPSKVGCYYMHGKNTTAPIIITCTPSLPELARRLEANGRKCALWIADEVHRTRAETIINGYEILKPFSSIGFGATPFRSKWKESLTLFQQKIVDYTADQAIKDGVVVELVPVFWQGHDAPLDEVCIQMCALATGPGMFNSVSIDDAEIFCMKLVENGVMAKTIHSDMPKHERKKRLDELRTGQLQALVHVNMLCEGADLPWLRWLCMRRPVGSRVRFIQELGRIVRAYTDPITGEKKTEAIVYDPHCLFQDFSMSYKEVLGGEIEDLDEEKPERVEKPSEKKKKQLEQLIFEVLRELVNVKAGKKPLSLTPLTAYLAELITAFDLCGLIPARKIANRDWRHRPATGKQRDAATALVRHAHKSVVPKVHRKPLEMIASHVPSMTQGLASDLITVMMSLADTKKWPDLKVLDRSAEESVRAHQQRSIPDMGKKPLATPSIVLPHKSNESNESKKVEEQKLFQ